MSPRLRPVVVSEWKRGSGDRIRILLSPESGAWAIEIRDEQLRASPTPHHCERAHRRITLPLHQVAYLERAAQAIRRECERLGIDPDQLAPHRDDVPEYTPSPLRLAR